MMEGIGNSSMDMPLSMVEVAYSIDQQDFTDPDLTLAQELDLILKPIWAQGSLSNIDSLELLLPSNEVVLEALTGSNRPWDDLHHKYYFLPKLRRIEVGEFVLTMTGDGSCHVNPLATHIVYVEGNMESITKNIPIDISRTPSIVENFFIGADFSPEEIRIYTDLFKKLCDVFSLSYEKMPGIDPRIIEHEIKNYHDAKLVQ
jgi:hypothetical protein